MECAELEDIDQTATIQRDDDDDLSMEYTTNVSSEFSFLISSLLRRQFLRPNNNRKVSEGTRKGQNSSMIQVSTLGIIEKDSRSFQKIRIRGITNLQHILTLQKQLQMGKLWREAVVGHEERRSTIESIQHHRSTHEDHPQQAEEESSTIENLEAQTFDHESQRENGDQYNKEEKGENKSSSSCVLGLQPPSLPQENSNSLHLAEKRRGMDPQQNEQKTEGSKRSVHIKLRFNENRGGSSRFVHQRLSIGDKIPGYDTRRVFSGKRVYNTTEEGGIDEVTSNPEEEKKRIQFWKTHYYHLHGPIKIVKRCAICIRRGEQVLREALRSSSLQKSSFPGGGTTAMEQEEERIFLKFLKKYYHESASSSLIFPSEICQKLSVVNQELHHATFRLGQGLAGYQYDITLHYVLSCEEAKVRKAIETLKQFGFINYFAPLRFGIHSKKNMHPGLHLLRGEFRAAANILLDPGEHYSFAGKNNNLSASGAKDNQKKDENDHQKNGGGRLRARLLDALASTADGGGSEESCEEAFKNGLGLSACQSLVHEFLSLIWNSYVTQRVKRYGPFAIVEGDLVIVRAEGKRSTREEEMSPESKSIPGTPPTDMIKQQLLGSAMDGVVDDLVVEGRSFFSSSSSSPINNNIDDSELPFVMRLHFVTAEDLKAKRFTPLDVVLPLPGFFTTLPKNDCGPMLERILAGFGIEKHPETNRWNLLAADAVEALAKMEEGMKGKMGKQQQEGAQLSQQLSNEEDLQNPSGQFIFGNALQLTFPGSYRRVVEQPKEFFSLLRKDPEDQQRSERTRSTSSSSFSHQKEVLSWSRLQDLSLKLSFQLPSHCYPQMMIRELTKCDVNTPEYLTFNDPESGLKSKQQAFDNLTPQEQHIYNKNINTIKRKKDYSGRIQGRIVHQARLLAQIFRDPNVRLLRKREK